MNSPVERNIAFFNLQTPPPPTPLAVIFLVKISKIFNGLNAAIHLSVLTKKKNFNPILAVLASVVVFGALPSRTARAAPACEAALTNNLMTFYEEEVKNLETRQIRKMNTEELADIQQHVPDFNEGRAQYISWGDAAKLLEFLRVHPVAGPRNADKFQSEDVEIGYCFGRAAYVHLMLLKMGLQRESIRKIWAIGPQVGLNKDIIWSFHVATIAFTKNSGWVTIDTNEIVPEPVSDWISVRNSRSTDKKMRFYVTAPSRFTPELSRYDRLQLGLDLPENEDVYKGYFKQLIASVAAQPLLDANAPLPPGSLQLRRLAPTSVLNVVTPVSQPETPSGLLQKVYDYFWN